MKIGSYTTGLEAIKPSESKDRPGASRRVSKSDQLSISNTSKAFMKLENFLNLGRPDRLNTDDLSDGERDEFLKMLSALLKKGIVGFEELEVNGRKEKHYIVTQIGDARLRGAKLYRKRWYDEVG